MDVSGEGFLQERRQSRGGWTYRVSHERNLADYRVYSRNLLNAPMNPADLFRQDSNTVQLAPGDFLFREGEKGDKMYVLLEGEIDLRLGDYVVQIARQGALIGQMALIENTPRAANAVAKTTCKLAVIDQRRFDFLVQQHPRFAIYVMKTLADHLRRLLHV